MKINPYYIFAALAIAVIVIIFVSRRDNAAAGWNSKNSILSTDNNGNLKSVTGVDFETELLNKVDIELGKVNTALAALDTKVGDNNAEVKKELNKKAASAHSHSKYASDSHSHSKYASDSHSHSKYATTSNTYTQKEIDETLDERTDTIKAAVKAGRDSIPNWWSTWDDFQRYANTVYKKL
tara:strand:+ start:73 stop:615 length:543 start_codon:yes stop_codon:yes gene_type:complete